MLKTLLEATALEVLQIAKNEIERESVGDGVNYLYFPGDPGSLTLLTAHVDTVRRYEDSTYKYKTTDGVEVVSTLKKQPLEISIEGSIVRNKGGILGADDRAGVYGLIAVYYSLKDTGIPMPGLLFTNFEESGGSGMYRFVDDVVKNEEHQSDIMRYNLLIELDRRGCNDWVTYNDFPKEAQAYIESFGFIESIGTFSDISILVEEILTPGVNLSCGYYHEHTDKEVLHVDELELTIARVIRMCENQLLKRLEVAKSYGKYRYSAYPYGYSNYGNRYDQWVDKKRGTMKGDGSIRWDSDYDFTDKEFQREYNKLVNAYRKEGNIKGKLERWEKDMLRDLARDKMDELLDDVSGIPKEDTLCWYCGSGIDDDGYCDICGCYVKNGSRRDVHDYGSAVRLA